MKQDPLIGAVYAKQLPTADCGIIERYTREFNYGEKSRIKSAEDVTELGIKTYFCSNDMRHIPGEISIWQQGDL